MRYTNNRKYRATGFLIMEEIIKNGFGMIVRQHDNFIFAKYSPPGKHRVYFDIHRIEDNKLISITWISDIIYNEEYMLNLFYKYCKGFKR
jgi:hypothetical protein